jgi:trimethylamine--corrinoid protein Co-methyltransferase
MGLGLIDDVIPTLAPVYEFAEMISNTSKPVLCWAYTLQEVVDIYRMAVAVAGSEEALRQRPFFALFSTFQSPLQHTDHDLENVLWAVERGIPVVYLGGPIVGLTSPATGASSLVIHLAEALSGLTIIQLKKRGAPVVIGSVPTAMDLRTARPSYGSPEMSLYSAAACDISRYLGIPFMGTAGASDSKLLDSQAAIETTIQVLMSALSGATLVHDVGFKDCADIGSLPVLVMNDEIIAMVKRIMRGVEVSDDTMMLDLIDQIGPGGHFVAEPRSASLCRQEIWVPQLLDRNAHTIWAQSGKRSMEERVWERVREILRTHEPPPLPEGAAEQIDAILREAEEREGMD